MATVLDDNELRLQRDLAYSRIISLCLETVLFGVLAVTFVSCLKKFLNQSPKRSNTTKKRDTFLFSTLKSMFYCNATHFVLTVYGIGDAFLTQWTEADGVDDDLLRGSTTVQTLFDVLQFYTFVTLTLFAHSIMIYRLSELYDKKLVVMIPVILLMIDAILGYLSPIAFVISIVFHCFTLLTNVVSTTLIMVRVVPSLRRKNVGWRRIISCAIQQSAAIYTGCSVAPVVTAFVSPNVGYLMSMSVLSPLAGIILSLLVKDITSSPEAESESESEEETKRIFVENDSEC